MALALAVGGGSELRKSIDETGGSDRSALEHICSARRSSECPHTDAS
jgi:hypothetical protein